MNFLKLKNSFQKISFLSLIYTLFLAPLQVFAAEPGDFGVPPSNPGGGGTDINTSIAMIISFLLSFIGAVAVLIIVIAGILYMTSTGDDTKTETAKKWIIYGSLRQLYRYRRL